MLPLPPGRPSTLGSCPTTIVTATPKTKPEMMGFDMKSAMKPRRTMPARTRPMPTNNASAEVKARNCAASAAPSAPTTPADITATVELVVTLTRRDVPSTA